MKQLDLLGDNDREIWNELQSIQRSIRGLFARFNYLEKEWIDRSRKEESQESEATHDQLVW